MESALHWLLAQSGTVVEVAAQAVNVAKANPERGVPMLSAVNNFVVRSNAWVSFIGFILGILGLVMTYRQAHGAKTAAEAARDAADGAAKKVIGFDASVSLYATLASLGQISDFIVAQRWSDAVAECVDVRKVLERALNAHVEMLQDNEQITALASYLDVLINNLYEKSHDANVALNLAEIQSALVSHVVALSGLCERLRYQEAKN